MKPARDTPFVRPLLTLAGLVAAGTLIWLLGPLLVIGQAAPLAGEAARWAALAALAVLMAAYAAWHAAQAERRNRRLMDGLVAPTIAMPRVSGVTPAASPDVAVIERRFEQAVALLKRSPIGRGRGLLARFASQPYVHQLPWYLLIGAPGAGKTTALVNSGLQFPLAAKLGEKVTRGVGGTRDCDWWFSDEAVLIDTAGRYTTQDSHREADQAAWLGFLGLLRRYRPRRPINGVLLTISASDLLLPKREKRLAHARELSLRIEELREQLGIRFPVYVLVTKTDLLAGFMEFFADFDKDERAQVWGVTLPYDAQALRADPRARLPEEFAALADRLNDCLVERLQGEPNRERRTLIYAFPQQWSALQAALLEFLEVALAPASSEHGPLVRGVYFSSATQEGTPIDRALGGVARALGLATHAMAALRPSGKAFFVNRLLRDLVFAEAGLAGTHLGWERRRALLRWGAIGIGACVVAATAALGWRSYATSRAEVAALREPVGRLARQVAGARDSAPTDLAALLPVLDTVQSLVRSGASPASAWQRLGLARGEMLVAAARDAYQSLLRQAFLPRIAARLEERLRSGKQDHVELTYDTLRAYLMLFGGKNFDRAALRAYLGADWEATLAPSVSAEQRDALRRHLDGLLAGGEVGAPSQADPQLVAKARTVVAGVPLVERVYGRLKQLDFGAGAAEFSVASAAGPAGSRVFARASRQPLDRGVPALYTSGVFQQSFHERAQAVLREFTSEESWVLGTTGASTREPSAQARLIGELDRLYVADYAKRWADFIDDLRLAPPADLAASAETARVLAGSDSPLLALLGGVAREVTVGPRPGPPAGSGVVDPRFEPLRSFVAGQPAPVGDVQAVLGRLAAHLSAVEDATRRKTVAPASEVTNELAAAAQHSPEPVRAMLAQLAATSAGQAFAALRAPLTRQLAAELATPCRAVAGRYPLVRSSSDEMSREDFARTFGAGGLIDGFFQRQLAPYVDTTARPWTLRGSDAAASAETAESLQQFQRARAIRDAFFHDAGRFGTRLEFRLIELDPGVGQFTLDVDGQVLRFRRDTRGAQSVQWPGPARSGRVQLQLTPASGGAASVHAFEGPWALFRLFDRVRVEPGSVPGRALLVFDVEGRKARFEVRSALPLNPLQRQELEQFRCPHQL